jgi:aryl-alcohol dehydrogenase-like predicted oxidoreductase
VATDDTIDFCRSYNIPLFAYSPLLGGAYARKDRIFPWQYAGRDSNCRLEILNSAAKELGCDANQAVISWMVNQTPPIIPVIGVSNITQLKTCLEAAKIHMDKEMVNMLTLACTSGAAW